MAVAANPCHDCGGVKHVGDGRLCQGCQKRREQKRRASQRAHAKRVLDTYGLRDGEYDKLLEAQGGVCYICHRKPGKKRFAVDHGHEKEKAGFSPRECVRGLLCRNCNYIVLGWLKEERAAYLRCIAYLEDPPAPKVLRKLGG